MKFALAACFATTTAAFAPVHHGGTNNIGRIRSIQLTGDNDALLQ